MRVQRFFDLPLLTKELVERSARIRTYWLRVLFALGLYIVFWSENRYRFRTDRTLDFLGIGDELFESLTLLIFFGIYSFVPATMCGVITQEKERDSLVLLLLTPLKPWRIVLQKYVAGLVPSLTILILALPLGAVCYTFGGFTTRELVWTTVILFTAILQIGALAVWCSSLFRTTGAAFIATYAFAAAMYLVPALIVTAEDEWRLKLLSSYSENLMAAHLPPAAYAFLQNAANSKPEPWLCCSVILGTTLLFLLLATYHLPRRAFTPSKAILRAVFGKIDRAVNRLNRFVGGLTFQRRSHSLPDEDPILWRERRARALAKPEHLVRLMLALLVPIVGLVIWATTESRAGYGQSEEFSVLGACFGILCILILAVMGSNCIVTERVKQTFEVLMTTPLSADKVIAEKARALRPLMIVLCVPLALIFITEAWVEVDHAANFFSERTARYLVCALGSILVQLSLVVWLSLWIGLWCRTRLRALATTLSAIIGWCTLPFVLLAVLDISNTSDTAGFLYLLSPLTVPALNEMNELDQIGNLQPWTLVLLHLGLYGSILVQIRTHCLRRGDAYLRR